MRILQDIGDKAVFYIQQNIDKSEDYNGKKFEPLSFQYWFYRYMRKKYKGKNIRGKGKRKWESFKTVAQNEFIGERQKVKLTATGAMRAALSTIETNDKDLTIKIGFIDTESAEKAWYHNFSGAGRGRVLRKFLGLQTEQKQDLTEYAAQLLSKNDVFLAGIIKNLEI